MFVWVSLVVWFSIRARVSDDSVVLAAVLPSVHCELNGSRSGGFVSSCRLSLGVQGGSAGRAGPSLMEPTVF